MDPFEGAAFSHLSTNFKCTIVGPQCLLSSLDEGLPVPDMPYPMYTAAMRDCIVTSTGFEKENKTKIQKLVEQMGGIYANAFHDGVTHLVADVRNIEAFKFMESILILFSKFTEGQIEKI